MTQSAETDDQALAAPGKHYESRGMVHVVPFPVLVGVFVALLALTYLTVAATWIDLGEMNVWIAMGVATVKAALVALFFMHLRYDSPFNGLVFVSSLAFLALFLTITLMDTLQYEPTITNW